MAYEINFSDSINKGKIVVEDRTINEETSIQIPGRNVTSYGQVIGENFLQMLENFANNIPPENPVEGQLWYDTTNGVDQLKVYDGTVWVAAGGLKKSTEAPDVSTSVVGDLWVDTDNQQLYLNSGSGWVLVGPSFSEGLSTGPRNSTITGTDDNNYKVVIIDLDAVPTVIISPAEFTPKAVIGGFSKIKRGVNLNSNAFNGGSLKYNGIAEKAEALIVPGEADPVAAINFLRGDAISRTDFPIRVKNDSGVTVGSTAQTSLENSAQTTVLRNAVSGSSLDLKVIKQNAPITALRIKSNQNDAPTVGINKLLPDEALDVVGNIKTSGKLFVNSTEESTDLDEGSIIAAGGMAIAKSLVIGGNLEVQGGELTIGNVHPDTTGRELGTESVPWNKVYATRFVGNLEGSVTGTIEGRATSANKLTSATTFNLTGDVSAQSFTFDGQTGGLTKTFNTSISNTFISTKPRERNPENADEILLNKVTGNTGLKKVTKQDLLDSVPKTPPGAMMMYGGTNAPARWLFCRGQEVLKSDYPALWETIGHSFRDPSLLNNPSATYFALPDFRGRFPLGYNEDAPISDDDRVKSPAAREFGATGGSPDKNIRRDNLPNHEHDLKDSENVQYYAITGSEQTVNSAGEVAPINIPTGTANTSGIPTSGGMRNGGQTGNNDWRIGSNGEELGNLFDVVNPFQNVNFIIYAGE